MPTMTQDVMAALGRLAPAPHQRVTEGVEQVNPTAASRQHMVLVAASRQQADLTYPVAALDLFTGGRVAGLRSLVGGVSALRRRVRVLSPSRGLVHADELVRRDFRGLTVERAYELRGLLASGLVAEWVLDGVPAEVLVVGSPLWMVALGGLLASSWRPRIHWYTESNVDWPRACAVLDSWGWL